MIGLPSSSVSGNSTHHIPAFVYMRRTSGNLFGVDESLKMIVHQIGSLMLLLERMVR